MKSLRNFISFLLVFAMMTQSVSAAVILYVNSSEMVKEGVGYECVPGDPLNGGDTCTLPLALEYPILEGETRTIRFKNAFVDAGGDIDVEDTGLTVQSDTTVDANIKDDDSADEDRRVGITSTHENPPPGLSIVGENIVIRGLRIHGINGTGISLDPYAKDVLIENNVIGLDVDGNASGNTKGIRVEGEDIDIKDNIISGNNEYGIEVWGPEEDGRTADITIEGNKIGVNEEGDARGNQSGGVYVKHKIEGDLKIGVDGGGNEISNNNGKGILVEGTINNLEIVGNEISDNEDDGIHINSPEVTGEISIEDNVIGSNTGDGIAIEGAGSSSDILPPADVTIKDNFIGIERHDESGEPPPEDKGNTGWGIKVNDGDRVILQNNVVANNSTLSTTDPSIEIGGTVKEVEIYGNKIGTWLDGITGASNFGAGIKIDGSTITNVIIGGIGALGNVIAGGQTGILISNLEENTTPVSIKGNYIGVGGDGNATTDLEITGDGIYLEKGLVTIGGDNEFGEDGTGDLGEGNVISNVTGDGISINDRNAEEGISGVNIFGNIIGLMKNATTGVYDAAAGNANAGIGIYSILYETLSIGEVGSGDNHHSSRRNVVSSNDTAINFEGVEGGTNFADSQINIKNNYIGTDWTGTNALDNEDGILVVELGENAIFTFGGTEENQGNVISGGSSGMEVTLSETVSATFNVLGNIFGLNATGTAIISVLQQDEVLKFSSENSTFHIGDGTEGGRNVISGGSVGVYLMSGIFKVLGNYVGTNLAGTGALGNEIGIYIEGQCQEVGEEVLCKTIDAEIGGDLNNAGERNVISGNNTGVLIFNHSEALNLALKGNYIGIGAHKSKLGNKAGVWRGNTVDGWGVVVFSEDGMAEGNGTIKIGGSNASEDGNVIAGNDGEGIYITQQLFSLDAGGKTQDHSSGYIKGNFLGVLKNGATLMSNGGEAELLISALETGDITGLTIGGSKNTTNNSVTGRPGMKFVEIATEDILNYATLEQSNTFASQVANYWERYVGGVLVDSVAFEEEEAPTGGGIVFLPPPPATDPPATDPPPSDPPPSDPPPSDPPPSDPPPTGDEDTQIVEPVTPPVTTTPAVRPTPAAPIVPAREPLSSEQVTELITSYEAKERKTPEPPEELEKAVETGKEVSESLNRISEGEVLTEEEEETVNRSIEQAVESSIATELKIAGSARIRIDGEWVEVGSTDEIEVVSDVLGRKSPLSTIPYRMANNRFLTASLLTMNEGVGASPENEKIVIRITNDSDHAGDGVADIVKIIWGYPVFGADRLDDDGIKLADEFWMGLFGYEDEEIPEKPYAAIGIRENAFSANVDQNFLLRIVGDAGDTVSIILVDAHDFENQTEVATEVLIDEDGKATVIVEEMEEGDYYILVRGGEGFGDISRVRVRKDEDSLETEVKEVEGAFEGVSEPGSIVLITWQSVTLSSVVMADVSQGEFKVEPPEELVAGRHSLMAFAYNPRTGRIGGVTRILFTKT